jgi:hypothetical protein
VCSGRALITASLVVRPNADTEQLAAATTPRLLPRVVGRRSCSVGRTCGQAADICSQARLLELAFRLPDKGDNAGNTAYVKLRTASPVQRVSWRRAMPLA